MCLCEPLWSGASCQLSSPECLQLNRLWVQLMTGKSFSSSDRPERGRAWVGPKSSAHNGENRGAHEGMLCVSWRMSPPGLTPIDPVRSHHAYHRPVACTGLRRGRGEMALRGHNRGPGGGHDSPSARGITIHDFITIFCHVGFSILQAVWAVQPN